MASAHDPVSVIHALDAACNAHDLDRVMALFTDDAEVRHTPPPDGVGVYHGKEQIRRWFEPQMPGLHVESRDHQAEGDTVRFSGLVTDDLLTHMGLPQPVEARNEAVIRGGKIVRFTVTNPSLMDKS